MKDYPVPKPPVCVECCVQMRPISNGILVVELAYNPPKPYKFYSADAYECPICKNKVTWGNSNCQNVDGNKPLLQILVKNSDYIVLVYEYSSHVERYAEEHNDRMAFILSSI